MGATVDEATILFADGFDGEGIDTFTPDGFADGVTDAFEGWILGGVEPFLASGGKEEADAAMFELDDPAKAEFGFGFTDPTLADVEGSHGRGHEVCNGT